ncbi:MAG: DNA methyltransferase, partial [Endozoicomonas sp.]
MIVGNGTMATMMDMGFKEAWCKIYDLPDSKALAMALVDNKSSDLHKWEEEMLAEIFLHLPEEYHELTGFEVPDISNLLDQFADVQLNEEKDDNIPDLVSEENCMVTPGDVWALGEHLLMCGDSLDQIRISEFIGAPVDLLHTDPPYNVSYVGKSSSKMTIDNDSMSPEEFRQFLEKAFFVAAANMKSGSPFYIWYADIEAVNFRESCTSQGLSIRQGLVWKKNNMVLGRQDYQWKHEPCLYGWKEGGAHYWAGGRKQTTVIDHDKPTKNDLHPTMKPVGLIEPLIKNSCPNGGVVLDLFGGSGSTLIACEKLNRKARLVELSPVFCHRIIQRWEEYTNKKAKKKELYVS